MPRHPGRRFRARSRGASSVEYAILLFLLIVVAVVVFKVVGSRVGHSASETVQRFDGKGGEGDKGGGAGGKGDKGGKAGAAGSAGAAASAGGAGGAGGNGDPAGGGGGGGGGNGNPASVETNDARAEEESHAFPIMKILAAVFVVLFAAAAFFAFRKGKASA
jgi:Flp pilus assembly pilin Flp